MDAKAWGVNAMGVDAVGEGEEGLRQEGVPMHWSPLGRVAFRISFLFFFCMLFLGGNGSMFSMIPFVGSWFDTIMTWPFNRLALWCGVHVFHLTGIAATWHPTGSGDQALFWIENGLFVMFAVGGGLLWTLVAVLRGSRRREYQTLYAWLRFGLRMTLGFFMASYGFHKVFPAQMQPMSVAVLNEPVGQMSPMTMLWSLIGMNPVYEMVCGAAEVAAGALVLFRRTALLGALLTAFVMTNVVLYNFFFDVPVKLFALSLLLSALFIALPDLKPLIDFFWRHQPAAPVGVWVPPVSRRGFRIATRTIELALTATFLVAMPVMEGLEWRTEHAAEKFGVPLLGAWEVDRAQAVTGAFIMPDGNPATNFYVDSAVRASVRTPGGQLWRLWLKLDDGKKTVALAFRGNEPVLYGWQMPDRDHLVLIPQEKDARQGGGKLAPVLLTRTAVAGHYPLLERGFHLVNEWPYQR